MINFVKTILATALLFFLFVPVVVGGTTLDKVSYATVAPADVQQKVSVDKELELKSADFKLFAKTKVKQLNRNHKFSRSRMEVVKKSDGTYRARYHQIDDSTLSVKVRRSQSGTIPYVGVISYREEVFESSAGNPESFDPEMFAVVEVIPNRHIFSYRKGNWN